MPKKTSHKYSIIAISVIIVAIVLVGLFVYIKNRNSSGSSITSQGCLKTRNAEHCPKDFIGLRESEAAKKAQSSNLVPITERRDGNTNIANDAPNGNFIYLTVVKDKVTKARFKLPN